MSVAAGTKEIDLLSYQAGTSPGVAAVYQRPKLFAERRAAPDWTHIGHLLTEIPQEHRIALKASDDRRTAKQYRTIRQVAHMHGRCMSIIRRLFSSEAMGTMHRAKEA
jgi:hypothetical protein